VSVLEQSPGRRMEAKTLVSVPGDHLSKESSRSTAELIIVKPSSYLQPNHELG
jgi:hypothetical protein